MNKKITVGLLFGGKSAEHEVSLRSAENITKALDARKYDIVPIYIDKTGTWILKNFNREVVIPHDLKSLDVVFPILHGPFGEDGTVQGLLKLANVPFVGAGVLGSAVGMDKDVMKRLLRDAGIPIGKFLVFKTNEKISFANVKKQLGLPFFVKPANMGSSVGISKVHNTKEFDGAIKKAFDFDTKIVIEEFIEGREFECAVLGNDKPIVSTVGEIVLNDEFYSYDTKYISEDGMRVEIPANISKKVIKEIQHVAVKVFQVLNCEGLGRVDFFINKKGKIIVNEINTIPGFTSMSVYPKLWEASGISYSKLIETLLQLAIQRFEKEQKLKTSYK